MAATNPRLRWLAPAAALGLAVTAPIAISAAAGASSGLPGRTAEELLVAIQDAEPTALSGEISQTLNLGLPDLSSLMPSGAAGRMHGASEFDPLSLASGTHRWRVWTDAVDSAKVALMAEGGEYSITSNGQDVWLWDSGAATAAHLTVPDHEKPSGHPGALVDSYTPQQLAEEVLAHIEPTTSVTTSGTDSVAGRPVYELVLAPEDPATTIGEIRIALDGETSTPLAVEVSNTGGVTAVDVAFTQVTFAEPDASVFTFVPPAAATVTEIETPGGSPWMHGDGTGMPQNRGMHDGWGMPRQDGSGTLPDGASPGDLAFAEPLVVGEGWSTVVVYPDLQGLLGPGGMPDPADLEGMLQQLDPEDAAALEEMRAGAGEMGAALQSLIAQLPAVSGDWGSGRLFEGTLLSVLLTDDGRVAVGAVTPEALYDALG